MRLGAMSQGLGGKVRGESEHSVEPEWPGMQLPWHARALEFISSTA